MKPDAPAEYRGDFRPDPHQRARHRRLRTSAAARPHRRQVHADPLDRPQLRRPRRRPQALPHRPRSAGSRPASSTTIRWSARWWPRCARRRTVGVPNYISGTDPGRERHRRLQLRLGLPRAVDAPVHGRPATRATRTSRCATWPCRRRLAERLTTAYELLDRLRHRCRAALDRTGTMAAMDDFAPAGPRPADDRHGPHGLRPVARAGKPCASATACTAGASGACWPGAWSRRGQLRDDGAGEPVPARRQRCRRTAPTTGTRTPSIATSSTTPSYRLPIYDRAVTALIEDLYARGLDKQGAADRHRRVRPHAADQLLGRHADRREAAGPRPLAAARCRCWCPAAACGRARSSARPTPAANIPRTGR